MYPMYPTYFGYTFFLDVSVSMILFISSSIPFDSLLLLSISPINTPLRTPFYPSIPLSIARSLSLKIYVLIIFSPHIINDYLVNSLYYLFIYIKCIFWGRTPLYPPLFSKSNPCLQIIVLKLHITLLALKIISLKCSTPWFCQCSFISLHFNQSQNIVHNYIYNHCTC